MRCCTIRLIFASTLMGFLIIPALAQAAAEKNEQAAPGAEEPAELCYKGIKASGMPNKLSVMASVSAIKLWTMAAKKYGDNYAMWHNARSSGVKCEKFAKSDFYKCTASGKPCRATSLDQATGVNKVN